MKTALLALLLGGAAFATGAAPLTVCTDGSPDGFDIVQYESLITADASQGIYDQLLGFKPGGTELVPGLAERWEISADGRSYTFHLRRGVTFQTTPWFTPTRAMNADDVLWSLNRLYDKNHPAHGAAKSGYIYWAGMSMTPLIKSIAKVDDLTVRIVLYHAEAPFLSAMAMSAIASIYSAEYGEQLRRAGKLEMLNVQPVGTGPYALRSYQKDAVIRYAAHPGHWRGPAKSDMLVFAITPDPNVRAQRVKAGECLIAVRMKRDAADAMANDPRVRISRDAPLLATYLTPNAKHRWTSDARFRRALWMAFDGKTYVESIYAGYAVPGGSFLPPNEWSHDPTLKAPRDVEAARALVKASGYDGTELTLFVSTGGSIDGKRAGELLQSDFARIGVKIRLVMMETGELARRTSRGEHDLALWSWFGDNGDPDNYFTPNLSCAAVAGGGNKSQWCHPPFEALIDEARGLADVERRKALYLKAQRIVYDEAPAIPLAYPQVMTALDKRVVGFVASPFSTNDFREVALR